MGKQFAGRPPAADFSEEEGAKAPPKSDLCPVSIAIHVAWERRNGDHCAATAQTLLVNHRGATIVLQQKLDTAEEISICRVGQGRDALARVVGLIGQESDGHVYGIALSDPTATPWDVELAQFPQVDLPEAEYYLECAACLTPAHIFLDSIQVKVFEARHLITLLCRECNKWTVWGLASQQTRSERVTEPNQTQVAEPTPRAENRRKHGRISTNLLAYVRSAGAMLGEVVRVKDVSRGGFRFQSPNHYPEGLLLRVAMPYTPNASNVFVPARIMWRHELRRLKRYEYGIAYEKTPQRS